MLISRQLKVVLMSEGCSEILRRNKYEQQFGLLLGKWFIGDRTPDFLILSN